MNTLEPFTPNFGSGVTVTASSTSANITVPENAESVCITNIGANIAYIKTGVLVGATASIADYPILPYAQAIITKSSSHGYFAYISAAGTSLHVMIGEGF